MRRVSAGGAPPTGSWRNGCCHKSLTLFSGKESVIMLTLTKEGCAGRRADLIKAANADLIVITNPRHIQYLCGLYVTPLALSAWGLNALFINSSNGETTLVYHTFIKSHAKHAHVDKFES